LAILGHPGYALLADPATLAPIAVEDGEVKIDNATVLAVDIPATNGVIHVIDSVIIPPARDAR
jgi:uncharacterized surface protein with fasciclin (FAS1) repeats